MDLKEKRRETDSTGLWLCPVAGCYEYGNEITGSVKDEFFDKLSYY